MEYNLVIKKLHRQNYETFSNVVIQVEWEYTGTNDQGISGTCYGHSVFNANSVSSGSFVNYNELSEDIIKAWVEERLDDQTSLYYRKFVTSQINDDIAKKTNNLQQTEYDSDLPWAPTPAQNPN